MAYEKALMKQSEVPHISFPPGRPDSSNIALICAHHKTRPRYIPKCLPRTGYGWLVRQSKAINVLEREYKQCCKEKKSDQRCAEKKVKRIGSQFSSQFLNSWKHFQMVNKTSLRNQQTNTSELSSKSNHSFKLKRKNWHYLFLLNLIFVAHKSWVSLLICFSGRRWLISFVKMRRKPKDSSLSVVERIRKKSSTPVLQPLPQIQNIDPLMEHSALLLLLQPSRHYVIHIQLPRACKTLFIPTWLFNKPTSG